MEMAIASGGALVVGYIAEKQYVAAAKVAPFPSLDHALRLCLRCVRARTVHTNYHNCVKSLTRLFNAGRTPPANCFDNAHAQVWIQGCAHPNESGAARNVEPQLDCIEAVDAVAQRVRVDCVLCHLHATVLVRSVVPGALTTVFFCASIVPLVGVSCLCRNQIYHSWLFIGGVTLVAHLD